MTENEIELNEREKALLISVDSGDFDAEVSMEELTLLAQTADACVVSTVIQKKSSPDAGTFIGSGKLAEITEFCKNNEIEVIIADGELTPSQQKNLERETDVRVIDRTTLILDIFARRAKSGEGKLQVSLAQLEYALPRLGGKGVSLSRLGGGIGTRGPGESKLESDRRHIRRRITALKAELSSLDERRGRYRERRRKDGIRTVALVGYTNAGKSTLMNALTDAGVIAEDKLFMTLDPTARALKLPCGASVMLIDTVGFVRRLPHGLVEAFKSTLDEARDADVILNVCDASSAYCYEQMTVTNDTLREIGCEGKPVITVLNKCDLVSDLFSLPVIGQSVHISARTGEGLDKLLEMAERALPETHRRVKLLLPYSELGCASALRRDGTVHSEEYVGDGLLLDVTADAASLDRLRDYIV